jgi:DNA (cytosine-5)-methyltransferase 1
LKYISLFSGIGGLESATRAPLLVCDIDEAARAVLRRRFPNSKIHDDVTALDPPPADVVAGGWPCQDISVAGLRRGLEGERSGLFFELLRIAERSGAHTVIAENVPNLLSLEGGSAFDLVLESFAASGLRYVAWRTINAREFGLPHERRRVFLVASRHREVALALHRPHPNAGEAGEDRGFAGFYWTAGLQSICYSKGFVPTLKVGSALSIPSPPALHFGDVVRKASPAEVLRLQGFDPTEFKDVAAKDIYRMAGNAVAAPVGRWVFESVVTSDPVTVPAGSFGFLGEGFLGEHGFFERGTKMILEHVRGPLATNLFEVVDSSDRKMLSPRAAAGLVRRLVRSGKPCPSDLLEILVEIARPELETEYRDGALARASRVAESGCSYGSSGPGEENAEVEEYNLELELFG